MKGFCFMSHLKKLRKNLSFSIKDLNFFNINRCYSLYQMRRRILYNVLTLSVFLAPPSSYAPSYSGSPPPVSGISSTLASPPDEDDPFLGYFEPIPGVWNDVPLDTFSGMYPVLWNCWEALMCGENIMMYMVMLKNYT